MEFASKNSVILHSELDGISPTHTLPLAFPSCCAVIASNFELWRGWMSIIASPKATKPNHQDRPLAMDQRRRTTNLDVRYRNSDVVLIRRENLLSNLCNVTILRAQQWLTDGRK